MEINEHLIKVRGDAIAISGPLVLGQDVQLLLEGSVTEIKEKDNQDGTKDVYYVVKGILTSNLDL